MEGGQAGRVVVGGEDMFSKFGLILSDDYEIGVPEYKRYTVELLGDGVVDLSEAGGDVFFKERALTLPMFVADQVGERDFEVLKSSVASWVHGKRASVELAADPGYTYEGRVRMATFERSSRVPCVTLVVDAAPYKTRGTVVFKANAAGGVRLRLDNGRARTQPTVEVYQDAVIGFEGRDWHLSAGTWQLEELWLHGGENIVTVNTTPGYGTALLEEYADATLASVAGKLLSELAAGDDPLQVPMTLAEWDAHDPGDAGRRMALFDFETTRLIELAHPVAEGSPELGDTNVYFEYEWREI